MGPPQGLSTQAICHNSLKAALAIPHGECHCLSLFLSWLFFCGSSTFCFPYIAMLLCSSLFWKAMLMSQRAEENVDGHGGKSFTFVGVWRGF